MCPQECVFGRDAYKERTQSPYQIWLARKVEKAVERALQHEGQQILEEYVVSRTWVLPQMCEERRLVSTKIHSLLLQWRPDFSSEWSLKLRRALPILEIVFSHMASSKEDFSNPLLIEHRLKGVLSLLDSSCHNKSPPLWPYQSPTHHNFASYLHCFHQPCLCSAEHIEAAEKPCICKSCLHVDEGRSNLNGQEACLCRSCLNVDKGRWDAKGHEAFLSPNLDEKRLREKTQNAHSCLSESCLHLEEQLDTKAHNASVFRSCLGVTNELDEGTLDDSLEWGEVNLPSRGTVATLMASELRSSRKEEANQALWNALASKEVALLKDNLHKHGEFASKQIVKKILTMLKRSKKEKLQGVKKVCAEQLLHAAAEEKKCHAELPISKMRRSLSKGLFRLFSCHTAASGEGGLPAYPTPSPTDLEALGLSSPCCLVCIHSKHVGDHAEKDDIIQAEVAISCSSNLISFSASSIETSTDDGNDNDNDVGSCHSIHDHIKSLHYTPINETPVSLVSNSTIINGSENLTCSSSTDSDDRHSRMSSGDVWACNHNVEVDITARDLASGYECVDVQIDLVQSSLYDGINVMKSIQVVCSNQDSNDINPANEDFGHTDNYDVRGASMVSCSHNGDSESHGRSSVIGHNDDDSRHFICSYITDDPEGGKERACLIDQRENNGSNNERREKGFMSEQTDTGLEGRREDPPNCSLSLEEAYRGPGVDIVVDKACNMMKFSSSKSILSHVNSNDQSLAEANMQTDFLHNDGERQEEEEATSSNMLQGDKDESKVAEVPSKVRATQSRDEERPGEGGAYERPRARIPLSSLLAEREDWSVQNTISSCRWRSGSSWDTWEEPNEALDPLCCVCMMGLKGAAFTPCGHTFCRKCSRELWKGRGTCPLCNKLITGILDIF